VRAASAPRTGGPASGAGWAPTWSPMPWNIRTTRCPIQPRPRTSPWGASHAACLSPASGGRVPRRSGEWGFQARWRWLLALTHGEEAADAAAVKDGAAPDVGSL